MKNDEALKKFLADLDTVNFNDLGDATFQGHTLNAVQWGVYQRIVKALDGLPDRCKGVMSLDYLTTPNPSEKDATVTVKMAQTITMDGEVKTALAAAAALCDMVFFSTMSDKIRASFSVSNIWTD